MHLSLGYPLGLQSSMVFNHDHHDHRDRAELEQCTVLGHTFLSEFGFKSHKQQSSSDLLDGGLFHRGQFSDQTHAPLELHKEAQRYHSVGSHPTTAMPAQSPGAGTLNTGQIAACLHPTGMLHDNEVRGSLRQRSMQMRSYQQ